MADPLVVLFLNSGRCGTQWLTAVLRELYPGLDVEHEPIGPLYAPRRYFRSYDAPEAILEVPEVAAHVERILGAERQYVETGWPLFPVLPLLGRALGDRLRVVHLTRHPVPSALSHLAHSSYAGSDRDDPYTRLATLGPHDPRVFQDGYVRRWDQLSAYEKCLFWWTEVHAFGLELGERVEAAIERVASERLLAGDHDELRRLLEFIELPWDERWIARTTRVVDRWHHHTDRTLDPFEVQRHPLTVEVAGALGYGVEDFDLERVLARYEGTPDPGLDRFASR